MKDILGHKSWSLSEIVTFLEVTNTFSVCLLPHYRYEPVQEKVRRLQEAGLVEISGKTSTGVNIRPTPLFRLWRKLKIENRTNLQPLKFASIMKGLL